MSFPPVGTPESIDLKELLGIGILSTREVDRGAGFLYIGGKYGYRFHQADRKQSQICYS